MKLNINIDGKIYSFTCLRVFTDVSEFKEISVDKTSSVNVKGLEYFLNIHNEDNLVLINNQEHIDFLKESNYFYSKADLVIVKNTVLDKLPRVSYVDATKPVMLNTVKLDLDRLVKTKSSEYKVSITQNSNIITNANLVFNFGPTKLTPTSEDNKNLEDSNIKVSLNNDGRVRNFSKLKSITDGLVAYTNNSSEPLVIDSLLLTDKYNYYSVTTEGNTLLDVMSNCVCENLNYLVLDPNGLNIDLGTMFLDTLNKVTCVCAHMQTYTIEVKVKKLIDYSFEINTRNVLTKDDLTKYSNKILAYLKPKGNMMLESNDVRVKSKLCCVVEK